MDDNDRAFITGKQASEYVQKLEFSAFRNKTHKSMRQRFASVKEKRLVNVLESLLQFNPGFRLSASECLEHEIFDKYRKD